MSIEQPYAKVIVEADTRGRLSINALDDRGAGHGHRLAGPKYAGDGAPVSISRAIDQRDVEGIRDYLRIADDIHAPYLPSQVRALTRALDRYKQAAAAYRTHGHLPHQQERMTNALEALQECAESVVGAIATAQLTPEIRS